MYICICMCICICVCMFYMNVYMLGCVIYILFICQYTHMRYRLIYRVYGRFAKKDDDSDKASCFIYILVSCQYTHEI